MPRWAVQVAGEIDVPMEAVDSCGILPLNAAGKAFARAHDFRRHVHREVWKELGAVPLEHPLEGPGLPTLDSLPASVLERWPATDLDAVDLSTLPIDHDVAPVAARRGGQVEARRVMERFVAERLGGYLDRNQPEADVASGLSPWLHWGHISAHEVFLAVTAAEGWDRSAIEGVKATGKREGWWGMSAAAEGFMDELVTWREVCLNLRGAPDGLRTLRQPTGLRPRDLAEHADDPRPHVSSSSSSARRPTTPSGTPPRTMRPKASSTTTCGCSGARRSCTGREPPGGPPDHGGARQQVRPRQARPELLGRDHVGPRATGPGVRSGDLREGAPATSDDTARVRVKNCVARCSGTETGSLF